MRHGLVALGALLWACLLWSCEVQPGPPLVSRGAAAPCSADADCPDGDVCNALVQACSSPEGTLSTLLFEVVPQATDPRYGSARYFQLVTGLDASSDEPLVLNVAERVAVQGQVDAAPEQAACTRGTSLPVMLTFTPREHLLGLSVPSYVFEARFDEVVTGEYRFSGSLPPGRYDVYMQPRPALTLPTGCNLAPQVFRDVAVGGQAGVGPSTGTALSPAQGSLRLSMGWRDDLEGWLVDVVHPVTGEVISTRSTLRASRAVDSSTGPVIEFTLHYSIGGTRDFIQPGEELVRFTPPPDAPPAGTVLLQRSGLELVTSGEGTIGNVTDFGDPVDFQSWVWRADDLNTPVEGTVSFVATSLAQVEPGVLASFSSSATVDALGQVKLLLLPGEYRVRVVPNPDSGLAASQYRVTVRPGVPSQQGHTIPVPSAAQMSGTVLTAAGNPVADAHVVLTASRTANGSCRQRPSSSAEATSCERSPAELQRALGEDPFVPRSRGALTQQSGAFTLDEVDCGACEAGREPARFDLTVRPPAASRLPWLVKTNVELDGTERGARLDSLRVPSPVVRPARVTFADGSLPLPGALVTAYAVLDASSTPVDDPESLPPCVAVGASEQRCLRSAIPVAEARSDSNGELLLLLPPRLE